MLISYNWLKTYFQDELPSPQRIAEAITMHAVEIESVEEREGDTIFDVKILPNRAHDCLAHHGIATEIAAIFDMKRTEKRFEKYEKVEAGAGIEVIVEDAKLCPRYIGRLVEGVTVGDSPDWLKERLSAIGQRPINIVVDIANYVMLDIGQPMHAFDADKVKGTINVRLAKEGETIATLDNKEVALNPSILIIADDAGPLAIAGIKGGKRAEVDAQTTRIILEAANFNSSAIRKTSQKISIKTDASKRFENEIAPELAKAGIEYATSLIVENISREVIVHESAEEYSRKRNPYKVGVSVGEINRLLGTDISESEVSKIFGRFGWKWEIADPLKTILELAPQLVGKPYRLGASVTYDASNEFDCSSFIAYVFAQAGIAVPRISVDQFVFGNAVEKRDLQAGDLVFSNTGEETNIKIYYESKEWLSGMPVPEGVTHVGLYLGDGEIIHSSRHNPEGVALEKLSESKQFENIVGYRRIPGIDEKRFVVAAPAVRLDLRIKEDLIEDIGRIYGYDKIPTTLPKRADTEPHANKLFSYSQKIRNILTGLGFDEVMTYAFQDSGEVELENPLASDKKFLRPDLATGLRKSLELNAHNAELLGQDVVKVFEIGNVFSKEGEEMRLGLGVKNAKKDKKKEDEKAADALVELLSSLGCPDSETQVKNGVAEISLSKVVSQLPDPKEYGSVLDVPDAAAKFRAISAYPFVLRDIAVWVPAETPVRELEDILVEMSGPLLAKHRLFDTFTKESDTGEKKTSYAFHLVFQSLEKTLSDEEVNEIMNRANDKIRSKSWEIR